METTLKNNLIQLVTDYPNLTLELLGYAKCMIEESQENPDSDNYNLIKKFFDENNIDAFPDNDFDRIYIINKKED